MTNAPLAVVAFSGGLDTSFCVWHLRRQGYEVVTACVDTGGFSDAERAWIGKRAALCGAREHHLLDGRERVYRQFVSYLIKANVLRGEVYPLCVAAERVAQAQMVAELALTLSAGALVHGSTGAGNDQVRFDVAWRILAPDLECLAPIRELALTRAQEAEQLRNAGIPVPDKTALLSINASLWGTTIGGGATHDSWAEPPDDAFTMTARPGEAPDAGVELTLRFENGLPVALDDRELGGVALIAALNERGAAHGIGRGIHLGDTIIGIKGRIAFEAPAPVILIAAHRELEKLVLTRWQQFWKRQLGEFYGKMLHEGEYFDPVMRDLEAAFDQASRRVEGEARVALRQGLLRVVGVRSRFSLMQEGIARYGEQQFGFTGEDVRGFGRILANQALLAKRVE